MADMRVGTLHNQERMIEWMEGRTRKGRGMIDWISNMIANAVGIIRFVTMYERLIRFPMWNISKQANVSDIVIKQVLRAGEFENYQGKVERTMSWDAQWRQKGERREWRNRSRRTIEGRVRDRMKRWRTQCEGISMWCKLIFCLLSWNI